MRWEGADAGIMVTEAVIAEQFVGESEFTKGDPQSVPGGSHGLVEARMSGEEEAGVVIEEGKGIDALAVDFEEALEVTLPEVIGLGSFEAMVGRR